MINGKKDKTADYHESLLEELRDPDVAESYLQIALEEYEQDQHHAAFMLALRNLTEAKGGLGELAKKTNLNRQNLYRILSEAGNPRLETLFSIMQALGYKLTVVKEQVSAAN